MANGTLKVSNIETSSGSGTITLGQSGETISIPSGCTITNSGTATNFGGTTAPYMMAKNSGDLAFSDNVYTVLAMTSEVVDSANAYDTSNYRFTPQTAGKYFVNVNITFGNTADNAIDKVNAVIYKNGSAVYYAQDDSDTVGVNYNQQINISGIIECNGSSDYIQGYGRVDVTSGSPYALFAYMSIFKMTE